MLGCRQCHNKQTSEKGKIKRNSAANHQVTRMTNSFPLPPNNLNRLSEKLAWITSMSKPSSESRTMTSIEGNWRQNRPHPWYKTGRYSIFRTMVWQIPTSHPPLKQRTGTIYQWWTFTKVGTSPTRLFKDTPNSERTNDGFLKPTTPKRKGAKSSKDEPLSSILVRREN